MKNQKDREVLFRQYLDGELSNELESQALHMIADDAEMREILNFERTLYRAYSDDSDIDSFSVPANFSDSVMDRLPVSSKAEPLPEKPTPIYSLFASRQITLNPVYAAAAALLIAFGFGYLLTNQNQPEPFFTADDFNTSTQVVSSADSQIWIRFVYFDDNAESIEIAGDFSEWSPVSLTREAMGDKKVWTGLIPMNRGEHRYMFVRNGEEWITDPLAEVQRDDGFGNKNAVIYL
jgi:hypothetical protein